MHYPESSLDALSRIELNTDTLKEMIPTKTEQKLLHTSRSMAKLNEKPDSRNSTPSNCEIDSSHD